MPSQVIANELQRALDQPGLSPNQVKAYETFFRNIEAEETAHVQSVVAEERQQHDEIVDVNVTRAKEFIAEKLPILKAANERKGVGSKELIDLRRDLRQALDALVGDGKGKQGLITTLESQQQRHEQMLADPGAYLDGFYRKYPMLAETRFNPKKHRR